MATPIDELPKSLQSMIADCRNAIANWDVDEATDDPIMQSTKDWTLRLSLGEFEQDLYWKCVAEDCEEVGDWSGAIEAYRKTLDLCDLHSFKYSEAYSSIGDVQRLLGDEEAALGSYETATTKLLTDDSRVLWRHRLAKEVFQLIRLGHIPRARKLLKRALETPEGEFVDHLGIAKMLIASARCDLAVRQSNSAGQSLRLAWDWLETLVQSWAADEDSLRQALGIHSTYAAWWLTEAKRRRVAREADSEVIALKHAIEKVRLCFTPCGYQRPWYNLKLMNLLLQLADTCERHCLTADAVASRKEAEDIFIARRFPESAKWPRYDEWPPRRSAFLRNWRQIFRRRSNNAGDGNESP
jgi:tetratricopeptide (TPR) repeat protein